MSICTERIQTVGQLRAYLRDIPDTALLDVTKDGKQLDMISVHYNGIFVDIKLDTHRIPGSGGYIAPLPFCLVADGVLEDTPCIIRAGTAYRKDAPEKYLRTQENELCSSWTPDPSEAMVFPTPDAAALHINLYLQYQKNATICPAQVAMVYPSETEPPRAD